MVNGALAKRVLLVLSLAATAATVSAVAVPAVDASLPASGSSAAPASSATYLNQHQPTRLTIKPHSYYSHVFVHNLIWSGWGQPTTTARGTFTFQFCVRESCSISPFYDEPVAASLSDIKRCRKQLSYTKLTLKVEGPLPDPSFKTYRTSVGACQPRRSGGH
jgi:hypothetical protein